MLLYVFLVFRRALFLQTPCQRCTELTFCHPKKVKKIIQGRKALLQIFAFLRHPWSLPYLFEILFLRSPFLWYPAPGFRSTNNGMLYAVGHSGYVWSSVMGSAAYFLYFYSDGITPQGAGYRSHGRQVRCLQE